MSDSMTPYLAAVRARLAGVTQAIRSYVTNRGGVVVLNGPFAIAEAEAIATLIEHAPTDLARLLALVEAGQEVEEMLKQLKGWIEHGLPEPPHQGSHTPESGCDINCMNEVQLSDDMGLATSALARYQAAIQEGR